MELTKPFSPEDFGDALESWAWIGVDALQPVVATLFGDIFFIGSDGWWFLDTIEGSLRHDWRTRDELLADLDSEAGQDRYLLGGLALAAHDRGLVLSESQVYDVMPPPVLGGAIQLDNLTVVEFRVKVHIAGQLHDQIRQRPPDALITGIAIS